MSIKRELQINKYFWQPLKVLLAIYRQSFSNDAGISQSSSMFWVFSEKSDTLVSLCNHMVHSGFTLSPATLTLRHFQSNLIKKESPKHNVRMHLWKLVVKKGTRTSGLKHKLRQELPGKLANTTPEYHPAAQGTWPVHHLAPLVQRTSWALCAAKQKTFDNQWKGKDIEHKPHSSLGMLYTK